MADMASKSANYTCYNLSNNVGLFLLCEAALGTPRKLHGTDCNADTLPKGFNSTQCEGCNLPDPAANKTLDKDIIVPSGKIIQNKDKKAHRSHNEFIVYNTDQIRIRYLVKVKFN